MAIYVRTQDRAKIVEISSITYSERKKTTRSKIGDSVTSEVIDVSHKILGDHTSLGEYVSKERCFEIMTEIQNTIVSHTGNTAIMYNMPEI
jgi:hypothetical protein